ncbi:MAG: DNA-processing protein DprA, partial [Bacteroidales bacterium]|nr:DNA-processing protein DprA [Bacteroidales bacterium]
MLYKIGVTLIPDIGDISIKKLISYCGSAAEVFRRKRDQLLKIPGLGPHMAKQIMSSTVLHRAEKELKFIQRHNITALFFTDYGYPEKLKHAIDGPALLFYRGTADLNAHRMVSVVGTRKPTQYGLHCCDTLIEQLKDCNVCIISGLAYGIDTRAHQRALELGMPTIGVLAHSLDFIYPYANRHLAKKIYANGGLVTDYISGTPPDRQNFPSRNRIVAGMADAVIVIESGIKGGALITADIANSYNRDVFAFPGKITDAMSLGCNKLINDHKAAIITA